MLHNQMTWQVVVDGKIISQHFSKIAAILKMERLRRQGYTAWVI